MSKMKIDSCAGRMAGWVAAGVLGVAVSLAAQEYPAPGQSEAEPREAPQEPRAEVETEATENGESLVDVIRETEGLERFAEILDHSGYAERFEEELSALRHSATTILAPHNDAFDEVSEEVIEKMKDPDNRLEVAEIIDSHLFPQGRTVEEMKDAPALFNYSARNVTVEEADDGSLSVRTEDAEVEIVEADLEADDGYVHVVDDFLVASLDESAFERDAMTPEVQQQPQQPQQEQPQQPRPQQPQQEADDDATPAPW